MLVFLREVFGFDLKVFLFLLAIVFLPPIVSVQFLRIDDISFPTCFWAAHTFSPFFFDGFFCLIYMSPGTLYSFPAKYSLSLFLTVGFSFAGLKTREG